MRLDNGPPDGGRILLTDTSCFINGASWPGVPTLLWSDGIDEDVSDWLRELMVKFGKSQSSAYEYCKIVRPFFRFCRQQRRSWTTVDDDFLILWRERLRRGHRKVGVNRINATLDRIFDFYVWAEQSGRLKYRVGIYLTEELPVELRDVSFAISAKRTLGKAGGGKVTSKWTTPLRLHGEVQPMRHTPTEKEIVRIHSVASRSQNAERNSLMLSWAQEVGARRFEINSLRCEQIPSYSELAEIIEKDRPFRLELRRKGGRVHSIRVPTELLIRTRDYIEYERRSIVERLAATREGYALTPEVFLSSTTGRPLHLESVTKLTGGLFREAGVKRASIHRLRASFAVNVINALLDAWFERDYLVGNESTWVETILTKTSEMMGHRSPESLRPYLTTVLNQRIQRADSVKNLELGVRLRQLEFMVRAAQARLAFTKELQDVSTLILNGENVAAAELLEGMARELRS